MPVIAGIVEHGDARGRELGFPTANIALESSEELNGVWAGTVQLASGQSLTTTVSVGRRRTFYAEDGPCLLEAHLLDFSGDLYGQHLVVHLEYYLRGQVTYGSVEELINQLHQDVDATRLWAKTDKSEGSYSPDRSEVAVNA